MMRQTRNARPAHASGKTPRGGVTRKLRGFIAAAFVAVAVLVAVPVLAQAALADYTVPGVTPNGTTINLFDYWLTTQNGADNSDPYGANNAGINDGHSLKFRQSGGNVSDGGNGKDQRLHRWFTTQPGPCEQHAHRRIPDPLGREGRYKESVPRVPLQRRAG